MAEYKWNIGVYQGDGNGADYKWNMGLDQTDSGAGGPSYIDAEASLSGIGTLSASAVVEETIFAEATFFGIGSLSASALVIGYVDAEAELSGMGMLTAVGKASLRAMIQKKRLVAIGNNQVFYEQIEGV